MLLENHPWIPPDEIKQGSVTKPAPGRSAAWKEILERMMVISWGFSLANALGGPKVNIVWKLTDTPEGKT